MRQESFCLVLYCIVDPPYLIDGGNGEDKGDAGEMSSRQIPVPLISSSYFLLSTESRAQLLDTFHCGRHAGDGRLEATRALWAFSITSEGTKDDDL
jgi:hypothetical protein